jgi:hypothetical protein
MCNTEYGRWRKRELLHTVARAGLCSLTPFESLLALGFRRSVSLLACVDGFYDVLCPSAGQILDLSTNFFTCGCDLVQSAPEFASE